MISATMAALQQDQFVLLQAATGSGKTIYFSELIRRLLTGWPGLRIAVLAHRRELVQQAHDKLKMVWPDAPIGVACASTGEKTNVDQPVTIGSIQTLAGRTGETEPFNLVIIDEAHRVPPKDAESQYGSWIATMLDFDPSLRVLGVTATPFRLGHGYIYGKGCKPGTENWFPRLHYKIGIKTLQSQGHLCGYRAKATVDIAGYLKGVKTSGGDYNLGALSEMMSKEIHVGSAVSAYQRYGEDRRHVVVFAVTIDHAEKLKTAFKDAGFKTGIVHSKMTIQQRDMMLSGFEAGELHFMINVGILVEGWDSTAVDCIIMCRPTKSPALYVQMTGRGLRVHPGKEDVLILDLANNCITHGDPDDPKVEIPQRKSLVEKTSSQKRCPNCSEMVQSRETECPACGHIWEMEPVVENNGSVDMRNLSFSASKPEPFTFTVSDHFMEDYTSKKGNRMVKLSLVDTTYLSPKTVNEFLLFDPDAHEFAQKKARALWMTIAKTSPPESTDEALMRADELLGEIPWVVQVIEDGRWLKVHTWEPKKEVEEAWVDGRPILAVEKQNIDAEVEYEDDIPF